MVSPAVHRRILQPGKGRTSAATIVTSAISNFLHPDDVGD
jgi:hypothetical protein